MSDLKDRMRALAATESTYPHILSAYFAIRDGGQDRIREAKIFLKNRASEIAQVLAGDARAQQGLAREVAVVERILEQDVPRAGGGLALFVMNGEVFERFEKPVAFENQIAYRRVPHIAQLAFMDEELEPYLIVVLDSRSARIFDVALGTAGGNKAEVQSAVHRRIRAGGISQMRYQRRVDNQKREHIEDVVTQIDAIVRASGHRRIMLVGNDRATALLQELMPADIRKRVLDRTALDSRATDKEVIESALAYFARAEDQEEAEKLRRARVEIHSTRMAVAGVDNVLRCMANGQVYELLLAHDFNEKGVECQECGAVSHGGVGRFSKCPSCDAPVERLKDVELREMLTRRALQFDIKLEYIKIPEFRATLGPCAAMLFSPER